MKKLYLALALLSLASCRDSAEETVKTAEIVGSIEGCNIYLIHSNLAINEHMVAVCKTDIVVDPLATEKDPQIPTWELSNVKK